MSYEGFCVGILWGYLAFFDFIFFQSRHCPSTDKNKPPLGDENGQHNIALAPLFFCLSIKYIYYVQYIPIWASHARTL